MGQATSMCRFRGCRYKKTKSYSNNKQSQQQENQQQQFEELCQNSPLITGLQLRSIEEPPIFLSAIHTGNKVASEQGGTGYNGADTSMLAARNSAPLHMQNSQSHQQTQQQQQQQNQPQNSANNTSILPQKSYDAEYARMESWLDENPEFVQDYFIRKATRQVVDAWLVSHATTAGNDVITTSGSPTHGGGQNCSSRGGSGATTPVRKISAHEFERGGLLKPIVNTIDGTPTFLSIATQNDCSVSSSGGSSGTSNGNVGGTGSFSGGQHHFYSNHYHHHNYQAGSNGVNGTVTGSGIVTGSGCVSTANSTVVASSVGAYAGSYYHHHHHGYLNRPQRLSRTELKQLDEKELIFELVKDICNELEVRTLCHKILQNVSILLNADRGSLFLVQGRCNNGSGDGPKKCLVSKLFDVCPRSTVEEMEQQNEVQIAWGSGIAGHVAESGEPVNIPDAYQDNRFNCEIDSLTGYRTKALLCMPIKDSSGDVIGVAQVINKLNGECFSETDEKVFSSYLQFCGIGLRNAQLYEKSQLEVKRNQVLLDLARMIFEEQSTIEHMVFRILTHMQSLIQCQRVQILLVHEASKGSFSRVFDFEANDLDEQDGSQPRTSPYESRFPINIGITGYVATTGETVNIPNAYEDDRFDQSVDEGLTFKHKSILCMAIKNSLGQIIGVIQLINKFDNLSFTKNDENFVEAFAIFCGMGIHNTHMYEKAIVAMAKQSVTLEVLSYHASATIDEAHRLRRLRVPSAAHFRLHDFKFDDLLFEDDDTLKACLRMFLDLDFVERFHIDYEVLCRWLLSVKKNYRNVTYHNWRHAFNVAQMMFAILTATQWWKIFGEIECLALIIGCLCHDLDHRGTNNMFQIKASSPLAQLYSTSTMEHHHFDQCLMILNSPGNQILGNLSPNDYSRVIRVLEDAILSTDLAVYLNKRSAFLQSVQQQPLCYWEREDSRSLLRAMSMTVCDLSAITKPWEIEKRVADLVSSEFFEQGDMEKKELNIEPIDIMNREKENELPMMQVNFVDSICMPIYEAFAHLSDKLEPLVEGVRNNRRHWIELAEEVKCLQNQNNDEDEELMHDNNSLSCIKSHELSVGMSNSNMDEEHDDEDDGCETEVLNDDEEQAADDADDDDSDLEMHNSSLHSCQSTVSSRLSTPPPTGDEDSSPTSPTKTAQAKLIAANLHNLNHKSLKMRSGCKSCEYSRHTSLRKTLSLQNSNDLPAQNGDCSSNACASGNSNSHHQHNHTHSHRHHHHQHHHHHHHYHAHNNQVQQAVIGGSTAAAAAAAAASVGVTLSSTVESDKIPKIVGKLANLDNMQFLSTATTNIGIEAMLPLPPLSTNAVLSLTPNCALNQLPNQLLMRRRHSETNGFIPKTLTDSVHASLMTTQK